jgi:hypothetical protein
MRNLFGPLAPSDYYDSSAPLPGAVGGGAQPTHGAAAHLMAANVIMPRLHDLLDKLRNRIERWDNAFWTDRLTSAEGEATASKDWENPSIPSGYTYLLQLIAHDAVHSAAAMSAGSEPRPVLQNLRQRPLMLDTIYGGGPGANVAAYELDVRHRDSRGNFPRTRLRLGPRRQLSDGSITSDCPFRDIARGATNTCAKDSPPRPLTDDGGLDNAVRRTWATEALIADQRNDAHALMSQMTVLFHLFHNQVMENLERRPAQISAPNAELASRRFLAARAGVTLVYRNIIAEDVLRRILHPDVYARYTQADSTLLDPTPGTTIEFAYAAFRFGHSMVRDEYRVHGTGELPMSRGLKQTSSRGQGYVPLDSSWLVDWARFFHTGTIDPNLSRRIGPDFSDAVKDSETFSDPNERDSLSLPTRDLMAAGFAGIWSVPKLYARMQGAVAGTPLAGLLPPYAVWREKMAEWLVLPSASGAGQITAAEAAAIASDPPLAFFVLFEAGHRIAGGVPVRAGGGRHLGPVGSIIVAEALFGALRQQCVGVETAGASLEARLAAVAHGLLADRDALRALSGIATMPDLLGFMARGGAFCPLK